MSRSAVEVRQALASRLEVSEDALPVQLAGGRTFAVPLDWQHRLAHVTAQGTEFFAPGRGNGGQGIHWLKMDEDVSDANLLARQPSAESQSSFERWLTARAKLAWTRRRSKAEPVATADQPRD